MHMNSVPQHLHSEDRQEYERVLDEALRSAPHHPELAGVGRRLNPEQLRTMALGATAFITAAAATEYQHYVKVREELRHPAPSPSASSARESGDAASGGAGIAAGLGEVAVEPAGAGAVAVAAVLTPVLAGTAAVIFLLVGYLLKALDPAPAFADALVTAGWVFGVVTALAILVATVGLLLTALRNRPALEAGPYNEQAEEVERAREAWRTALLERGFLPYFREALAEQGPTATTVPRTPPPSRLPNLGYDRPGFTSPDDGPDPGHRPRFSSPDYTSPDFGGPDNQPD
jgi:hypothetical protein